MRRFAHCLILLLSPCAAALADDTFSQSQRGACVYADSKEAGTATPITARTPARSAAAAPRTPRSAENSGGGGSDEDLMQRMRAPRWHSFLPGMFR